MQVLCIDHLITEILNKAKDIYSVIITIIYLSKLSFSDLEMLLVCSSPSGDVW